MIDIKFVPHNKNNVRFIADNMRYADKLEVIAAGDSDPLSAINRSIKSSIYVTVAEYDNTPLVIFGMGRPNTLTGRAMIWMLGTEQARQYKREFIVYTRTVFSEMLTHADILYNYVHVRNKDSIRWLKHLGAVFDDPIVMGVYGEQFMKFEVRNV